MKIKECIEAVYQLENKSIREKGSNYQPNIVIYMEYDFFIECMQEICGSVEPFVYEFFEARTIMGYPVYRVTPHENIRTGQITHHAPWKIFVEN